MSKPAPFPHHYTVRLEDRRLIAAPRAPIAAGPPPQFGGTDQVWSPEDLLIGAVLECLWTTFEAYARRDGLAVAAWSGTGTGILDRGPGGPVFTSISLQVELTVAPADEERARRVVATAEKNCIISNALRVPVSVTVDIRPTQALDRSA
jgi:organic hydroperoxide reductase OsmC/OhrA